MKRGIVSTLLVGGMLTSLSAGGDLVKVSPYEVESEVKVLVEPIKEKAVEKVEKKEAHPSDYYLTLKGLSIAGEQVAHHEADNGLGLGVDLGYRLGKGFATELGVSYAKNKLKNTAEDDASYKTAALSLVYDLELTESLALFAKGGYMYEKEKVSALNIDSSEKGLVYGAGLSYKLTDSMNLVGEYEASAIDSLRGDAIGLGLMFNF